MITIDDILKRIRKVGSDGGHNDESCCDACLDLKSAVEQLALWIKDHVSENAEV